METYHGYVRTPADAIKLFEACRLGLLPRVQRRLSEKERQSIRSGSVFVWDEREAGMRRWTDGKSWSASRVSGSFLTYREMEGKRGSGFGNGRRGATKTPDSGRGSDEDQENGEPEGYRYKADGLMKQSFSITTSAGQHLHLISYYSRPQPGSPDLLQPSTDSQLRNITPVKGMYPESSLHDSNPTPALTRAPMVSQHSPYMVPQHAPQGLPPQPYASQYAQHSQGYAWPPSPVATPPYSHHYTATPYSQHPQQAPAGAQALPPPHSLTGHPHAAAHGQHYSQHPPQPERTALPPLNSHQKPLAPSPYQSQQQSPRISHAQHSHRLDGSPRLAHLQAQAAQAVGIDPARATPVFATQTLFLLSSTMAHILRLTRPQTELFPFHRLAAHTRTAIRMSTNGKDGPASEGKSRAFSSGIVAHVGLCELRIRRMGIHHMTGQMSVLHSSGPYTHLDYDNVMTGCSSTNIILE
ncbi:cAMP-independent regulatory protein pac2 [Verticillium alfalfae VaMs.102]|uniref:cAMP-independent regulatory protein pac2 n=1 Tax=Verticillium alfalfae (strain VaMs.102 / ATCC MYA-4576 / FGSC 10136) TaxID=526221 RepID=C9SFK3_VERA1|nr:cAMP-independent regulatory protein pac2 [Verticillium alfalfae VaMs.102]EEY17336.1 cAMP-independent regulatory protein pac2 [Verticillium alfalfae VaMs.102]